MDKFKWLYKQSQYSRVEQQTVQCHPKKTNIEPENDGFK